MIIYDAIADLVVTIHAAYVGFVVLGFTAIVLGSAMGWRWVRNLYFRVAHLAAILLVCLEALIGVPCPLTTLENRLRVLSRGRPYAEAFVGHLLDRLVFYSFPQWLFTMVYLSFGALVLLTFILAPPRLSGWTKSPSKMARAASVPQR
jgi:Protein of Unknown function (DUF2784)